MTTIEGGMITTNDKGIAEKVAMIRNHGIKNNLHVTFGLNFRTNDLAAAIGLEQLKKLKNCNKKRVANAVLLNKLLKNAKGIITPDLKNSVFHQYTIRVTDEFKYSRDELAKLLTDKGIGNKVYYAMPIPEQPYYKKLGYSSDFPVCSKICKEVLSIPVHPKLSKNDIVKVAKTILSLQ